MNTLKSLVAALALSPVLAMAAPVSPGEYSISGIQNICLKSDGTWYSTTFSNWAGHWEITNRKLYVYGNYADGVGNDSMVFKKNGEAGFWTEWRDGLPAVATFRDQVLTLVNSVCAAPAMAPNGAATGNPMDSTH